MAGSEPTLVKYDDEGGLQDMIPRVTTPNCVRPEENGALDFVLLQNTPDTHNPANNHKKAHTHHAHKVQTTISPTR